jgi:polyisoprenyl-phosphate glycosyltransferase
LRAQTNHKMKIKKVYIILPVFNDWASLERLISDFALLSLNNPSEVSFVAIDDGSSESTPDNWNPPLETWIVQLRRNVGHQRAIALGIGLIVKKWQAEHIIVMDSDGEDCVKDIPRLIELAQQSEADIIEASRGKRSENYSFKLGYWLFKKAASLIAAQNITSGNFCYLNHRAAHRLLHMHELWNHFPAARLASRLKISHVECDRGVRYFGTSKMNLTSLIIHGLSAISVFSETALARALIAVIGLIIVLFISIGAVIIIKLFTQLAISGWASIVSAIFFMGILTMLMSLSTLGALLLVQRSRRVVLPIEEVDNYVADVKRQGITQN